MRTVPLVALLLAACAEEPLDLVIPTLPGATHLLMTGSGPGTRWTYRLEVTSRVRQQVRLDARLDGPATEGVAVRIADGTEVVPREGTSWPRLIVEAPKVKGPFRGALVISSPDVPDWSIRYTFEGEVTREGLPGRNLVARPAGFPLGMVRPGEERTFAVAIASVGDLPVTIQGCVAENPAFVRLPPLREPVTVVPGGEYQLAVSVVAPRAAGEFELRARVDSDAENHKNGLILRFGGQVVPDYAPHPPRAVETSAYPVEQQEFKVVIRARDEVPAFTIAEVHGHERHFEVVSLGTKEPAREQTVRFKLRRDAPTDPAEDAQWQVRFRIEPGGVDVAWPLKVRLNPPIHARPGAIDFRRMPPGAEKEQEILLTAYANRTFRVTAARAERRQVQVSLPDHAPGTSWRVVVSMPKGVAQGSVEDRVVIETDDPDVPHLIVPVKG